jgi:hypothetical protein
MAKPRKRGARFGRRRPPEPPVTSDEAHLRATQDITERLAKIAQSRQAPNSSSRGTHHDEPESFAIELRGAQVIDCKLISPRSDFTGAEVISINAYSDRERSESVVIRIDGWDGHLCVVLPRDRAALLIKKLEHAVDTSRDPKSLRPGTSPVSPQEPGVIVDSSRPEGKPPRHAGRRMKRGRALKGHQAATDQVLDELADRDETPGGEDE